MSGSGSSSSSSSTTLVVAGLELGRLDGHPDRCVRMVWNRSIAVSRASESTGTSSEIADPVGALVDLHVEDLLIDRDRVVDDHDDLGLRVEIRTRPDEQIVEIDHRIVGRGSRPEHVLPEVLELPQLALDLGVDVERLLALAGAALVAGDDELAHLLPQLGVAAAGAAGDRCSVSAFASSSSTSSGVSPRACWR